MWLFPRDSAEISLDLTSLWRDYVPITEPVPTDWLVQMEMNQEVENKYSPKYMSQVRWKKKSQAGMSQGEYRWVLVIKSTTTLKIPNYIWNICVPRIRIKLLDCMACLVKNSLGKLITHWQSLWSKIWFSNSWITQVAPTSLSLSLLPISLSQVQKVDWWMSWSENISSVLTD